MIELILLLLVQEVRLKTKEFITEPIYWAVDTSKENILLTSENEVFLFDKNGLLRAKGGGTGDGPGQFRRIGVTSFVGSASGEQYIAVFDVRRFEITILDMNLKYKGRINRMIRNIFPTKNGFAVTDLSGLAMKDTSRSKSFTTGTLNVPEEGQMDWLIESQFHPYSQKLVEHKFAWSQHFFKEVSDGYLVGFSLEPILYKYDRQGVLLSTSPMNLYAFIETPNQRDPNLKAYDWHASFSEVFDIFEISGEYFVYFTVPKNPKLITRPSRLPSLPLISNHTSYIQCLSDKKYTRIPDNYILTNLNKGQNGYEMELLRYNDENFDPEYYFCLRELMFQ